MNVEEQHRKKILGQFFSGKKLGNLLAAFAFEKDKDVRSIIDPMCGVGDLLKAACKLNPSADLVGIDIDPKVITLIEEDLKENNKIKLFKGSAFSKEIINQLPNHQYDLVITNPPYVRYQSLSKRVEDLPTSEEIRNSLLELIPLFNHLEDKDKEIFKLVTRAYSGLADLAVPSWILSSMLTKIGGKIAIIVPESWLNRDYAYPIHYILLKLFNIEYVIEDVDRVWFKEDAQVKTNLIIAKRIPRIMDLWSYYDQKSYCHISISNEHSDKNSIVGKIFPNLNNPELKLVHEIKKAAFQGTKGLSVKRMRFRDDLENFCINSSKKKWFKSLEQEHDISIKSVAIPKSIKDEILTASEDFCSLEELGVRIGQGLRTGANKFFYVDCISQSDEISEVLPDSSLFSSSISIPNDALRVAIRKQSELPEGYCIDIEQLSGRVLILDRYIRNSDLIGREYQNSSRKLMSDNLADHITNAETINIGSREKPKYLPQLSAVSPNIKAMKNGDLDTAGFWYMLPKLTKRHLPDIFVARVNGKKPKFYMNSNPKAVVDANFSTIWFEHNKKLNNFSLIALLNSDWVLLCCEFIGSIMGAGALKLEATHLRKIPIPKLSIFDLEKLSELGKRIIKGYNELEEINNLIAKNIFKTEKGCSIGKTKIRHLLKSKLMYRTRGE